jgi:hypothetical protein
MSTPYVPVHLRTVSTCHTVSSSDAMSSPHRSSIGPQGLPAPLPRADTGRPLSPASRPATLRLCTPLLCAFLLLVTPWQGVAYWTGSTSEEYPPIGCQPGDLISGVYCTGSNCDNLALSCADTNYTPAVRSWLPFISEETPNTRLCPNLGFITGLACQGRYCDNVAVECTTMYGHAVSGPCQWTPWVSEEGGGLTFPTSYYAVGVACIGSYCDNIAFYVCRVN